MSQIIEIIVENKKYQIEWALSEYFDIPNIKTNQTNDRLLLLVFYYIIYVTDCNLANMLNKEN